MLYRLEVENFYSIRDRQVIDLRVARNTPNEDGRLAPIWQGAAERAPKVVAFFGANASGKSNVLKALPFLAWFLRSSFQAAPDAWMQYAPFQDDVMSDRPTRLAFSCAGPADPHRAGAPDVVPCEYAYEVSLIGPAMQPQRVLSESLTYRPPGASRSIRLFERDEDGHVRPGRALDLAEYDKVLDKILRPNASVISTLAQLNQPFATMLSNVWALVNANIFVERTDYAEGEVARYYASNDQHLKRLNRELARLDLGIKAMHVQQSGLGPTLRFEHVGLFGPLPRQMESNGTWQFVKLFPLLIRALEAGGIAVVDELDQAIHPLVLPEILSWFRDPEDNPHDAQLWISGQNASLLEDLSKEEAFLCEKNSAGATHVYGLRDIMSVRRDDNYYRKYLGGVYGAVPHVA